MAGKFNAEAVADNAHAAGGTKFVLNWAEGFLWQPLNRTRRFPCRLAYCSRVAANNVSGYDVVEKDSYNYVPKGTYVYGPRSECLIIRRIRYCISLLPDQEKGTDC